MNNLTKILIVVGILFVLVLGTSYFINKSKKVDYTTENTIELKGEKIPTIYNLLKIGKVTKSKEGIDSSGNYIQVTYTGLNEHDIAEYVGHFLDTGYLLIESSPTKINIAKTSSEKDKLININITYENNITIIKYSKVSGTLSKD